MITKYPFKTKIFTYTILGLISVSVVGVLIYLYFHQPQVVIVPHHDVVKELRRQVLSQVAVRRFKTRTIVLISPDHFNPTQHGITSSTADWTTATAPILYDPIVGQSLEPLTVNDPTALKNDHGIYALLPDLVAAFPQAKLVPILVGQALKPQNLISLSNILKQTCRTDCLIIASVDFSHYLPVALANVHDAYSQKVITNRDLEHVMDLEVDSPQALYLALNHARSNHANHFVLKHHTNSGSLLGNSDIESTSHLLGWFERGQPTLDTTSTFVFATNLSLDHSRKTVGNRFFYGADLIDTRLDQRQVLNENLIINPLGTVASSISVTNNILTVNLADDLAIAGIIHDHTWQLTLLPLTGSGNQRTLTRGQAKIARIQALLSPLPANFILNPQAGLITFMP